MPVKFAVIGCGRMGKLHARVLSEMDAAELVGVADTHAAAAEAVAAQRRCAWTTDWRELADRIDAAVIATPTVHHMDIARDLAAAGKHLLIEKPLTDDLAAGEAFIELARAHGAIVQVGHAERFNPAVIAMRKHAIRPKFIDCLRISPYTFRSTDVGVVLDMMIHDIDIVLMLAGGERVVSVDAVGVNVIGATEDIANARVRFANGCIANITASRLSIKTERKVHVFSEEAYLSVNYHARSGVVIKKNANLNLLQMGRRMNAEDLAHLAATGDYRKLVNVEQLVVDDTAEPLRLQAEAFVASIEEGRTPDISAAAGLAAVHLAQRITETIKTHPWDGDPATGRVGLGVLGEG
ncbi:MAG: Gfo/Idh/MocA family oxidoreductase [Planctomycetes bacterium]|nr:Gfo/Idh/MocA family oxidoreductase [Planctomycetota bacterium]